MPETTPTDPAATPSMPTLVWLWQRRPDSTDLEKALIPAHLIPDGWLPLLQHRYTAGDRVQFDYDTVTQLGTVVQDQGMYLAIDGDKPGSGYTIHKTDVHPHNAEPTAPTEPVIATAIEPHAHPAVRREGHTATAYWNLGQPAAGGRQTRARLQISFHDGIGFVATLSSIDELHCGEHRERPRPLDSVVVHHHPTRRPSHHAVRECLRDAIDVVISAAGQREPTVCVHFVPVLGAQPEK
ncbi:hypothetical protein [Amycolatopsis sp. NPDC051371]|uniref:hypothetical protein n=1 Tax=Amycolatopsis sp. NPDC051371 TaxID=3155800 RepID=UPI0034184026